MKKLAVACALALALSGCSATIKELSSPEATQAAANVKAFSQGFVCGLGSLTGLASNIQAQLKSQMNAGNAMVATDTAIVYVVSSSVCMALGGKIAGATPVVVPSTATTSTTVLP